jgi:hypothetical protein
LHTEWKKELSRKNPVVPFAQAITLAILAPKAIEQSGAQREPYITAILQLILDAAVAQLPELTENIKCISYLTVVSRKDATSEQLSTVRFTTGASDNIRAILVLQQVLTPEHGAPEHGAKVSTASNILLATRNAPRFILPVHSIEKEVRPGPPAAFSQNEPVALNVGKIDFKAGVPNGIRREIKRHFKSINVNSLLAVPMQAGAEIVGIVSIEATSHIFDNIDGRIGEVALSLYPLCMALGSLTAGDLA